MTLFLLFYTLLYFIVLLSILPHEYFKRPRPLRKRWLKERLGKCRAEEQKDKGVELKKTIWIHAVSVGEVIASVPFIREVSKRFPFVRIILTTVTDTGQKMAQEKLSGSVTTCYIPFDLPFAIKRFIGSVRPSLYISIETEIWPNLFYMLKREGVSVLVMNGRLSDDSFKGYKKIRFFMKRVLNNGDLFCMQEEAYGERIKALGVPEGKICITGNFKFDIRIEEYRDGWVRYLQRPVILAGSTHRGEEEIIIDVFERFSEELSNITLIIAPRHPERFGEVEEIIKKRGIKYIKRSVIDNNNPERVTEARIILIDLIGELASLYSICDVAIIGGSFSGRGGHNPLEPAFWGKPILCGDDMRNFPFIEDFYRCGAAVKTSKRGLYNDLRNLLIFEDKRVEMGKRAKEIFESRAGAIERSVDVLKRYLELP